MTPVYGLAIDFTQWGTARDVITPERIAAWKEAGVRKVIVGAGYHDPAVQQIRACAEAGLSVDLYRFLFWGRPMAEQVEYALSIAADSDCAIGRLWLDCEDAVIWEPEEMWVKILEASYVATGALPMGIYTRRDWWERFVSNTDMFADRPLWDARYDGVADFEYFEPYGGWQKPAIKQYAGNVDLGGMQVDLNCYRR